MKDISDAADLIDAARDALMRELLPTLAREQRYVGLMIANAMAIALREQRSGGDVVREELGRLRNLIAEANPGAASTDGALEDLRRTLSAYIRSGHFDEGERASALVDHLQRTAAGWVAISNPKAVRAEPLTKHVA